MSFCITIIHLFILKILVRAPDHFANVPEGIKDAYILNKTDQLITTNIVVLKF